MAYKWLAQCMLLLLLLLLLHPTLHSHRTGWRV
jgi:hypothetical protein